MEFLPQQNRRCEGDHGRSMNRRLLAEGKRVLIIGGGDTGADCLGTSHRQGAKSVHQIEIMPKPPEIAQRQPHGRYGRCNCAPRAPTKKAASATGHQQVSSPATNNGNVKQFHAVRVGPPPKFEPSPAPNSRSTSISYCSPWASSVRCSAG